jgi:hypothetical protein
MRWPTPTLGVKSRGVPVAPVTRFRANLNRPVSRNPWPHHIYTYHKELFQLVSVSVRVVVADHHERECGTP